MTDATDHVVRLGAEAVTRALARVSLPARAYAVGLWGSGEEDLNAAAVVCIGLEPDRDAALAEGAEPPGRLIWNVSEYAIEVSGEPDLRDDAEFAAAEQQALEDLEAAGVWDPQRWVFNRVARAVSGGHPLDPVTDDFVVFAFADDFGEELAENLRFSGGPAADLLDRRGLLPVHSRRLG